MAGTKKVTFNELKAMKFNVIERFGITQNKRGIHFFIQETIPPIAYGYDCKDYTWYEVSLKNPDDLQNLKDFLKDMFNVSVDFKSNAEIKRVVKALRQLITSTATIEDWGACHVTRLPISENFRKER